jgi:hypothetical protein
MGRLKWWRVAQVLMAIAFVLSVAVQVNDPDPIQWMLVYGAAAIATIWAAIRPEAIPRWLPALVGVAALAWAAILAPQVMGKVQVRELFASWEMKSPRVEVARETGGLLIVAAWMAVTWVGCRWAGAGAAGPGPSVEPKT